MGCRDDGADEVIPASNTLKSQAAIDLGHRRLRAVEAVIERGRATVVRSVDVALPDDVADAPDAERGAFVAATIADWFRDQGHDVMLVMDSVTRLAMAQRQIGLARIDP